MGIEDKIDKWARMDDTFLRGCDHRYVRYRGVQQSGRDDIPDIVLADCVKCYNTISMRDKYVYLKDNLYEIKGDDTDA